MPAKAKVTKEMIVDAAFAIAREAGAENINARTVSERLHCSTQPVMYHFATMEELKRTVYAKADLYHSEYLRFLYKGIIIKHNKTEPTYTKTSLFLCEKRRFFMARTEKGVVTTI